MPTRSMASLGLTVVSLVTTLASALGGAAGAQQQAVSPPGAASTAREAADAVKRLYFAQDFPAASAVADAQRTRFASEPELLAWRALAVARAGRADEAIAAADSVAKRFPASPWGAFARAFTLAWKQPDSKEAMALARRVRAAMPRSRDAVWLHGSLLHRAGEYAKVVALTDSAARRLGPWGELLVLKANALASTGSDSTAQARARDAFAEARRVEPGNLNAHYLAAANLRDQGRGDTTAWVLLRRALEISPNSPSVLSAFWQRLRQHPTLTDAQKDSILRAGVVRILADTTAGTLRRAAQAYQALERHGEQRVLEDRLLAQFPTTAEAEQVEFARVGALQDSLFKQEVADTADARRRLRLMRERYLARPRHLEQNSLASAMLNHFLEIQDDSAVGADSLRRLGDRLVVLNKLNPHITHVDLPMAVAERRAHFRWAERLVRSGDSTRRREVERMKEFYVREGGVGQYASTLDFVKGQTHQSLGWIYLHEGRMADAKREYAKARDLIKNNPRLYYHLGRLAEAEGNMDEAKRMYARGYPLEGRMAGRKNTEALTRLYKGTTGSLEGFDAYVAKLREEDLARRKQEIAAKRLPKGDPMPAFALERLGAGGVRLTEKALAGKIVVINFWGVWCGPCVVEIPHIQKFHEAVKNDSAVVFLTVDYADQLSVLQEFMAKRKLDFPVLLDEKDWVSSKAKVTGFPTTWFFGRDGRLAFRHSGASDGVFDEFMTRVELLKAEGAKQP